jgi:hypothetical protein
MEKSKEYFFTIVYEVNKLETRLIGYLENNVTLNLISLKKKSINSNSQILEFRPSFILKIIISNY